MRNNLLYFATLSDLAKDPVLIWDDIVATDKSAINVSSVSPDLCETIVLKLAFLASEITSKVSLKVPIWFGLIKILLAHLLSIPFFNLFELVTNRSSPTTWTFLPISAVIFFHYSQSSSAKGSSMDLIGYFEINFL